MSNWGEPAVIGREGSRRADPQWLADRWVDPAARLLLLDERCGLPADAAGTELDYQACVGAPRPDDLFLGLAGRGPVFARRGPGTAGRSLRDLGATLAREDRELATTACALANWHAAAPHCPGCGAATTPIDGGFARACLRCGAQHFPRHDPAMIVAVVDDEDRLLLGHQGAWAPGRWSVLAGFVEAGESLEACVHREVFEEAGVRLSDVTYVASQPWPFPRSLMVAFAARAATTDVVPDGREIVAAQFYTRAEVRAGVAAATMLLPGPASVSLALIEGWLAGTLRVRPGS